MGHVLEFTGESLARARDTLLENMPKDMFLVGLDEYAPSKLTETASGGTTEKAITKAKKNIPDNAIKLSRSILQERSTEKRNVHAFSEGEARDEVENDLDENSFIYKLTLSQLGRKGFLGIGKKPHLYETDITHNSIISIEYVIPACVTAEFTSDLEVANSNFWRFCESGDIDIVKQLLKQKVDIQTCDENGATGLILAAFNGHHDVCDLLIERGINIHKQDNGGFNALMIACESDKANLVIIKKLIEKGADVNAQSARGSTALMAAAKIGHLSIVDYLITHGADVNAKNSDHHVTPLIWAANEGHELIVMHLLSNGANPSTKTTNNYTAETIAAENGHYVISNLIRTHE